MKGHYVGFYYQAYPGAHGQKEMTPAALQRDRGRNERTLCRLLL
nr:MAG TPA: hypothetical protein [Caudoviricetes sp.]